MSKGRVAGPGPVPSLPGYHGQSPNGGYLSFKRVAPLLLVQGTVFIGLDSAGTRGLLTMNLDRTARKQLTRLLIL